MTQIVYRDPSELTIAPMLKRQPGEWSNDDPRFEAMVDDIADRGIDQPLLIDGKNRVWEGRHRLRAAKRNQLAKVPCIVIDEKDGPVVIVQSLLQRRHYNASQRAYLLAPTLDDAFAAAQARMLSGGKGPSALSAEGVKTIEEWATTINVSVRYLRDARRIHEAFLDEKPRQLNGENGKKSKPITLREHFEPQILADDKPVGLGAVIAGIAGIIDAEKKGKPHKGGKPDDTERQLQLFNQVVTDELNRWDYWQSFDAETKAAHFKTVRAKAATLNPEQLEQMAEYHETLAKQFRKAAKEASNTEKN